MCILLITLYYWVSICDMCMCRHGRRNVKYWCHQKRVTRKYIVSHLKKYFVNQQKHALCALLIWTTSIVLLCVHIILSKYLELRQLYWWYSSVKTKGSIWTLKSEQILHLGIAWQNISRYFLKKLQKLYILSFVIYTCEYTCEYKCQTTLVNLCWSQHVQRQYITIRTPAHLSPEPGGTCQHIHRQAHECIDLITQWDYNPNTHPITYHAPVRVINSN